LDEVEKPVVGKHTFLEKFFCTILADGHVLMEDLPGLTKTLTARSFSHRFDQKYLPKGIVVGKLKYNAE
jgi:MoxR-like ATPase